jgi:uncharacterized protein (TIGR03083 family)
MHALDVLKYGNLTLLHALENLAEEDWRAPNVCGVWSVREIVAHLASFEHVLVDALGAARGEPPGPHLTDMLRDGQAFNDTQVPARAGLSPIETLAEYEATCARAAALAAVLPTTLFYNTGFLPAYGLEYDLDDFITYSFYGHKREHAAQIMVFRDQIGR